MKSLQAKIVKQYTYTPEQLKRYIIDVYDKNSLSELEIRLSCVTGKRKKRMRDLI